MKNQYILSTLILAFLLSWNIGNGQNARQLAKQAEANYVDGQYLEASLKAIEALRAEIKNKTAFEVLDKSYDACIYNVEMEIAKYVSKSQTFSGDNTVLDKTWIVKRYNDLIGLQREATILGPVTNKKLKRTINFPTKDYTVQMLAAEEELHASKLQCAEMHYLAGDQLFNLGGRENSKSAALEFKESLRLIPGYSDAQAQYDVARKAGTSRMAFIPFDNKSGKPYLGAVEDVISDQVVARLFNDPVAMEFVELLTRDQLNVVMNEHNLMGSQFMKEESAMNFGKLMGVHVLITGKITSITYDAKPTTKSGIPQSKKVKVGSEVYYVDGKKKYRNVYGTVHATVTKYNRSAEASINGSYQILDVETARLLGGDSFNETERWSLTWGRYTGNVKALSREYNNLCSVQEQYAPNQETMVKDVANKLAVTLSTSLSYQIR